MHAIIQKPLFILALSLTLGAVGCKKTTSGPADQNNNNNNNDTTPYCGNGALDPGEGCDGDQLAGQDCASLGLGAGTLTCGDDCRFDISACANQALCGNGVREYPEDCDATDLGGAQCTDVGFTGGQLACTGLCSFDTAGCEIVAQCGNGRVEAPEQCDGENLDGQTCISLGLLGGTLSCGLACTFNVSQCTVQPACGNGRVEGGEPCDGPDLRGNDCRALGFYGGTLACRSDCSAFDTSACNGYCGDNRWTGPERCDGSDVGGQDCRSQGFYRGTLVCLPDCSALDLSVCSGQCGDGVTDGAEGEGCDDGAANSDVAADACRSDCQPARCGDGVQDTGEECDDGNLVDGDGCSRICTILNPPTCTVLAPLDGERRPYLEDFNPPVLTEWTLVADATDVEDGALGGTQVEWYSDVLGLLGTGRVLTVALSPPYTHEIRCVATDSDNMSGEDAITIEAYSPVVVIYHPGNGEVRGDCSISSFPWSGVAYDFEDGDLSSSLVWVSDRDGQIGTGASFSTCLNGLGVNTTTASVTDGNGNSASDTVTLTIVR